MRLRACGAIFSTLLVLVVPRVAFAGDDRGRTWDLAALRRFSGLTAEEWNALNRGRVEAKVLDTGEARQVAVVGAARVHATAACFVARLQNIETFEKSPDVIGIRKFVPPVDAPDFEGFTLQPRDIADLPDCTVGDCGVKLSASMIEHLRRAVDQSGPGYAAQAQSTVREDLLNYIRRYQQQGNPALIVYFDKPSPVRLADQFRQILNASPGLSGLAPEFMNYLARYPKGSLPGVTDFYYWSTEIFGLKPVASITQVEIYAQPGHAIVASKQLYASHYFDGSLGLTAALDDGDPAHPDMVLVYLNRSNIDLLSGFFGHLRSAILRGRLRDGMRKNLTDVVRRLESECP